MSLPRYEGFEPLIWQSYDEKISIKLGRDIHQKILSVLWRRAVHITRS